MKLSHPLYLDYSASTPVNPLIIEKMLPYFSDHFGNSVANHTWGWTAQQAVNKARKQVAQLINCREDEIVFTSSCTESNNWVLQKLSETLKTEGPLHIITTNIEHSSVAKVIDYLEAEKSIEITRLPASPSGIVSVDDFKAAIKPHTKLASIIWVQNEIGTIQPIEEISRFCEERQIYLHVDGTQAVGKFPVDLQKINISTLSFSGHKLYAPKGVGILYHRKSSPHVPLKPLLIGGGHEFGLRSSSINVPYVVAMGMACEIAQHKMSSEWERVDKIRKSALKRASEISPNIISNGDSEKRIPHILHVTLKGANVENMLPHLPQLGLSQGAACGASSGLMSPVLNSLGFSVRQAQESFRISIGQPTTEAEVLEAIEFLSFLGFNK